jgi:hypothetical protein
MQAFSPALATLRRLWRNFGPYLVIELLLPGGSLVALALFLYRRNAPARAAARLDVRRLAAWTSQARCG